MKNYLILRKLYIWVSCIGKVVIDQYTMKLNLLDIFNVDPTTKFHKNPSIGFGCETYGQI
jgi:hypothetical protein